MKKLGNKKVKNSFLPSNQLHVWDSNVALEKTETRADKKD
jgi:hypothetical protein